MVTASSARGDNVDEAEVAKFNASAARWWDREGEFRPLHEINPLRLAFIERQCRLDGRRVADVGCGGGILAEALARSGARVCAIDMAPDSLEVARLHLLESGLDIDYRCLTAEGLAAEMPGAFDVVTCMELLEHVPDPASLIAACARLVRPGGDGFFSTLNRTPRAYLEAIVGAEYLLRMLPHGTHDYARFIRPSELATWCRAAGLEPAAMTGIRYCPVTRRFRLDDDVQVNYILHVRRPAD